MIGHGGIERFAEVGLLALRIAGGLEGGAIDAHAGDGDVALLLKGVDHFDEAAEEDGLLLGVEGADCGSEEFGPTGGAGGDIFPARGKAQVDGAGVARGALLLEEFLAHERGDRIAHGGFGKREFFGDFGNSEGGGTPAPEEGKDLGLSGREPVLAGFGPALVSENQRDLGKPGEEPGFDAVINDRQCCLHN